MSKYLFANCLTMNKNSPNIEQPLPTHMNQQNDEVLRITANIPQKPIYQPTYISKCLERIEKIFEIFNRYKKSK